MRMVQESRLSLKFWTWITIHLAAQLAENPTTSGKENREPPAQSSRATVKTFTVGKLGGFPMEGNTQVGKLFKRA